MVLNSKGHLLWSVVLCSSLTRSILMNIDADIYCRDAAQPCVPCLRSAGELRKKLLGEGVRADAPARYPDLPQRWCGHSDHA